MKKALTAIILCCISLLPFAQQKSPSQAEIDALMKNMQQQVDSVSNDPTLKKIMNQTRTIVMPAAANKPGAINEFEKKKLPVKDLTRLRSIPKNGFSITELSSYLADLYTQLSKKLPPGAVSSANSIAARLGNDPVKIEAAAALAWQKGAVEEAILLITKAATNAKDDGLLLTNAAAMLDMIGLSEKAIPILRTVIHYDPENAIALNNQGQAFTRLGETDSALYYLGRCIKLSPNHPEANTTAGLIELKKGNKKSAQTYFENSLRGGFNLIAYHGLQSTNKDFRLAPLIRPKVKFPAYFNQFKYKLPRQCKKVSEAIELQEEYDAFKKLIRRLKEKYERLEKEAGEQYRNNGIERIKNDVLVKRKNPFRPFQIMATFMLTETLGDWAADIAKLDNNFNKDHKQQYEQLEQEYSSVATLECPQGDAVKDKYLPRFAQLTEEWQSRRLHIEKKYFDELLYWHYLSSFDEHDFLGRFYNAAANYMYVLQQLCQTKFLTPCQQYQAEDKPEPEESEIKKPECPLEIEIPLIVGKIELDCDKFSFKAGEGLLFKYEKSFSKRQSTMSLGIGAEIYKIGKKIGNVNIGAEAGMGMSAFFNFDAKGNLSDAGMQYGAKASAGIEFEAGEKLKIKKEEKIDAGLGWRFGYHSGISFDEGPLKGILSPPEKQVNKNIKIYKPN